MNNQQNKKYDTSMNYFYTTAYWGPLVSNSGSVDDTTNPYLKNTRAPYVSENEVEFVHMFQYTFVHISLLKMNIFKWNIQKY